MKNNGRSSLYVVGGIDGFLYWLAVSVMRIYFRVFLGLKIDRSEVKGLKGPVLVLANHESNFDFLITAIAFYPLKLHFMVTTYFFHHSLLARLLRRMGCIPKKQFVPDIQSVKCVLHTVEKGESVCIFPEGQTCYTGEMSEIDLSTAKLIKRLGITTAVMSIRGNHLTFPKWAKGKKFPSKVEAAARVILTPKEISEAPLEVIEKKLIDSLYYNEYEWQRSVMYKSKKPRTTDRLENILYRCPACHTDFSVTSDGKRRLICDNCGYTVIVDDYGFFQTENGKNPIFDNPVDWFNYERKAMLEEFTRGGLPFSSPCSLSRTVEGKQGYFPCGEGTMTLDETGLHFRGTKLGEPFEVDTRYEHQTVIPHNSGLWAADIHGENENYALIPDDSRKMIKFVEGYLLLRKHYENLR